MPGCTALYCTNSSKKGYKVYHFPTDEERCLQWVQNLGRGESWVPTKHTCVCEVHFEESQFESHRADGLKKLRPFAIPTIFDVKLSVHSPIRPKEIHRMKRGLSSLKEHLISEDSSVETNDIVKPAKRGRGRPLGSSNKRGKLPLKLAPKISIRKAKIQERLLDETVDMESFCDEVSNINVDVISCIENGDKCFLCGKVSPSNSDTQVATPTYTTNLPMLKRLERLALSEGLDLSLAPNGVLCIRCSHILNFLDRAEMECSMLNKTIAMCLVKMRDRNSKEQTEEGVCKLSPTVCEVVNTQGNCEDHDKAKFWKENTKEPLENCDKHENPNEKDTKMIRELETSKKNHTKDFECVICGYQTKYNSVMIFHLRQHSQSDNYQCDFCNIICKYESIPMDSPKSKKKILENCVKDPLTLHQAIKMNVNYMPANLVDKCSNFVDNHYEVNRLDILKAKNAQVVTNQSKINKQPIFATI